VPVEEDGMTVKEVPKIDGATTAAISTTFWCRRNMCSTYENRAG
jgi:hypothetical protein